MKVRLKASTGRQIADTGQIVEPDGTAEVPDELGDRLCEQPDTWAAVGKPRRKNKADDATDEEGD